MADVLVLTPAGGIGTRLGRRTPKQFLTLGGGSILAATVAHFTRHPAIGGVVVAAPAAHVNRARPAPHVNRARRALSARRRSGAITVVPGGSTRQESVWLALQAAPDDADLVV